jgi:hypothetical protein
MIDQVMPINAGWLWAPLKAQLKAECEQGNTVDMATGELQMTEVSEGVVLVARCSNLQGMCHRVATSSVSRSRGGNE